MKTKYNVEICKAVYHDINYEVEAPSELQAGELAKAIAKKDWLLIPVGCTLFSLHRPTKQSLLHHQGVASHYGVASHCGARRLMTNRP